MPRAQAEALANIQRNTVTQAIDAKELATKQDLLILKKDMMELRADIARWFISGMLALAGLTIASVGVGVAILAWLIPGKI